MLTGWQVIVIVVSRQLSFEEYTLQMVKSFDIQMSNAHDYYNVGKVSGICRQKTIRTQPKSECSTQAKTNQQKPPSKNQTIKS